MRNQWRILQVQQIVREILQLQQHFYVLVCQHILPGKTCSCAICRWRYCCNRLVELGVEGISSTVLWIRIIFTSRFQMLFFTCHYWFKQTGVSYFVLKRKKLEVMSACRHWSIVSHCQQSLVCWSSWISFRELRYQIIILSFTKRRLKVK